MGSISKSELRHIQDLAEFGDEIGVQRRLEALGITAHQIDEHTLDKEYLIHKACKHNASLSHFLTLLNKGADARAVTLSRKNILHILASQFKQNAKEILNFIATDLSHLKDLHFSPDTAGLYPLSIAVRTGLPSTVDAFLRAWAEAGRLYEADTHLFDGHGCTLFHYALHNPEVLASHFLQLRAHISGDVLPSLGMSLIWYACKQRLGYGLSVLLGLFARYEPVLYTRIMRPAYLSTPIALATGNGCDYVLDTLLCHGTKLAHVWQTSLSVNLLQLAVSKEHAGVVRCLIEHGAEGLLRDGKDMKAGGIIRWMLKCTASEEIYDALMPHAHLYPADWSNEPFLAKVAKAPMDAIARCMPLACKPLVQYLAETSRPVVHASPWPPKLYEWLIVRVRQREKRQWWPPLPEFTEKDEAFVNHVLKRRTHMESWSRRQHAVHLWCMVWHQTEE
jgi:hypothetical protein